MQDQGSHAGLFSWWQITAKSFQGVQVFFGHFFGFFWVFVWFYVRGCCKNCKSHKDETNAEAAIGLFWVFFWVLPSWVMQTVQ